jgi:amidophosphoribosyltransferase
LKGLREECGVVGIYGHDEAAKLAYLGLHALQHRGQEGAGICTSDGQQLRAYRGRGLVGDVFNQDNLATLLGNTAIGHVRYGTAGDSTLRNVQPLVVRYRDGQVAIAHNGNLVNAPRLRSELEARGSIFGTSSDTEVILHLLATSGQVTFVNRLLDALLQVTGAYSLVLMTEDKMVAVRDPLGFRPLVLGRLGEAAVVASETCALDLLGATFEREIEPGEMLIWDRDGVTSLMPFPRQQRKACVFEHIYFARPNSEVFGRSVYDSRFDWGKRLSEIAPVEADLVIPVPDSGTPAALGYAFAAQLAFKQGLIRSHYVGRTFIEPNQQIRDFGVKLKLSPVRSVIEGQRLIVVDDSIVRGTTSRKIVRLLRESGAAEVHVRICSPPIVASCYYGVDTPTREELIAHRLDIAETCTFIGADSLAYLPLETLRGDLGDDASRFCDACFSGDYPVPPEPPVADTQLGLFTPGPSSEV